MLFNVYQTVIRLEDVVFNLWLSECEFLFLGFNLVGLRLSRIFVEAVIERIKPG